MLRNKLHFILLPSFIGGLLLPGSVNAERVYGQIEPPRFKIGRFALKYEMDRFHAKSNYTANGGVDAKLPGSFEAYNAYLGVENDLSTKWSLSGGILAGLSKNSKGGVSRRNMDVKGLQFGINRNLKLKAFPKLSIIADLKYFQALHNNKFGSEEVSLGDGTSWAQVGSWVGTDAFKHARLWFYGGINWPFKGLSKNFVFLIRPEFKLKGGRLGIGIEGQHPIVKDTIGDPTERLRLIDEYNGGSFYYHAIDSKYVGGSAWFGFEPAPLTEVKIGISELLSGRSASQGPRIFVSLELSFSVSRTGYEFPYINLKRGESKIQRNRGIRRLKNYAKPKAKRKKKP